MENMPRDVQRSVALRARIALAYHERWCGSPPSCRAKTTSECNGVMDDRSLDAVMVAVIVFEREVPSGDPVRR